MTNRNLPTIAGLCLAAILLPASACGGGGGGGAGANAGVVADPDAPYCDVERAIDERFETAFAGVGEDASEQEQVAAARQASQAVVDAGLLDDAQRQAPEAVRDDVGLLVANVRAAAGGNVEVFFTAESDAAGARVDAYCGLAD